MSGALSCKQCGCSDITQDPERGNAVCTKCGCVIEESFIVSEVTFEEDGHGGASAVGQFVSSDSQGGAGLSRTIAGYRSGFGKDSRALTLRAAKQKISDVAQQLRLNQVCIDQANRFFELSLGKQLTKGRKASLTIAACVYMACRINATEHLLIDLSDALQVDIYALGRAFAQIARALNIHFPLLDPCLFILRYASRLDLGEKTSAVVVTASRLVERMKKDWIHWGRRPSGICGAALLIAARLHGFNRTVKNVIDLVKVHETTLRKRLVEFGETPSSSLTLDDFMTVDLEEEHDPPSFKAARIKDREVLQKLLHTDLSQEFKDMQNKIEEGLIKHKRKVINKSRSSSPSSDTFNSGLNPLKEKDDEKRFIIESTLSTINTLITSSPSQTSEKPSTCKGFQSPIDGITKVAEMSEGKKYIDRDRILMPPPQSTSNCVTANDLAIELVDDENINNEDVGNELIEAEDGELDLNGIDDNEINSYIMNSHEVKKKKALWEKLNADYILLQKQKQEQLERDIKEGKVDLKKKKKNEKAKPTFQAKTATDAIKIMLQERKLLSSKINYDVLRSLTSTDDPEEVSVPANNSLFTEPVTVIESGPIIPLGSGGIKRNTDNQTEQAGPSTSKRSRSSRKRHKSEAVEETSENFDAVPSMEDSLKPSKISEESESDNEKTCESEDEGVESESVKLVSDESTKVASDVSELRSHNENEVIDDEIHYIEDDEDDDVCEEYEEEPDVETFSAQSLLDRFRGKGSDDDDYSD